MGDVTVSEVARRVDLSVGTLRRWVREGIGLMGFDEAAELHLVRRR